MVPKAQNEICVYHFSVDYRSFDFSDTANIHNYLMEKYDIK